MVLDPTVLVDGKPLWEAGLFKIGHFAQTRECADRWPDLEAAFDDLVREIGLNL